MKHHRLLAVFFLATIAAAQTATVTPYGTACGRVISTVTWAGLPQIGQSMTLIHSPATRFSQITSYTAWMVMSVPRGSWANGPLPWLLPPTMTNSVSGCLLYVAPDFEMVGVASPASDEDRLTLAIPNNPLLLGLTVDCQYVPTSYRFHQNYLWFQTSSALRLVVGL